ncbi:RidA family protein [Candidatus Saccharibacteria bacterium]|nr:RidA family protein [Candidatus Saccharibacteria bacterium]
MSVQRITPDGWQKTRGVYSPACKISLGGGKYLIFVSGQQARKNEETHEVLWPDDAEAQAEDVFKQINEILKTAGAGMKHVVKAVIYLTDFENDFKKVSAVRDKWFADSKPVSTCVGATEFSRKGARVEIEVTAIVEEG